MDLIGPLAISQNARKSRGSRDDDFIDRLNNTYTVGLLVLFTVIVSTSQFVGDPIQCWCPAQFTDNYIDYANKVCWVKNTYFIPMKKEIPKTINEKPHLTYYQWTPFILLFQALLFYFPGVIWFSMNDSSGIDVSEMVGAADVFKDCTSYDERSKVVKFIVRHMDRYLEIRRQCKRISAGAGCFQRLKRAVGQCLSVGRRYGNFLVVLYMFTKVLYVINAVSQLFILNAFLGTDYHAYGLAVLTQLAWGEEIKESPQFPRVTLCDFPIREIQKRPHEYTVQCVLQVNLFNEKIFIFIWFWLVLMIIVSIYSLIRWLARCLSRVDRYHYVRSRIETMHDIKNQEDRRLLKLFTHDYLMSDGLFTLRMIAKNTADIVSIEILSGMWEHYKDVKPIRDKEDEADRDLDLDTELTPM